MLMQWRWRSSRCLPEPQPEPEPQPQFQPEPKPRGPQGGPVPAAQGEGHLHGAGHPTLTLCVSSTNRSPTLCSLSVLKLSCVQTWAKSQPLKADLTSTLALTFKAASKSTSLLVHIYFSSLLTLTLTRLVNLPNPNANANPNLNPNSSNPATVLVSQEIGLTITRTLICLYDSSETTRPLQQCKSNRNPEPNPPTLPMSSSSWPN